MARYFWVTIIVLFVFACVMGWKMDRKRKGNVRGRAGEAMDARANEAVMRNRRDQGPI
ncbi:MAG: hypothetical protein HHJ13_07585 [Phycicoccus sp.]|nr:hypothetical protein [Phycicoccus sp.]